MNFMKIPVLMACMSSVPSQTITLSIDSAKRLGIISPSGKLVGASSGRSFSFGTTTTIKKDLGHE